VKEVVLGWSDGFKQKPKMGRRNNQNFTCLPLAKLRDLTALKLRQAGIHVTVSEEAYTSKASSLDGDLVPAYGEKPEGLKFSGARITRGQYRTREHGIIHADVNGAWNIIRKRNHDLVVGNGIVVMPAGRTPKWRPCSANREHTVL
jgi:IS605 OrfB family transposase